MESGRSTPLSKTFHAFIPCLLVDIFHDNQSIATCIIHRIRRKTQHQIFIFASVTMKTNFLIATLALITGLISAQDGLPTCAQSCVAGFTSGSQIGGCSSVDIVCICSSSTFLSGIACCLAGKCDAADQQAATEYAQNLCKASGVTNLPSAVSCASTAAASTGSSSVDVVATASSGQSSSAITSVTDASHISATSSVSSHESSPTATENACPQNGAVVGVGMIGGLAAIVALL